jgi:chromate transporter
MEQTVALQSDHPSFRELVQVFGRIGCLSFGGPAGQIALMHRELVEERQWVEEEQFLHALNFCHLLPGPEAQQLATWIGWRLHGMKGGLAVGLLFVIPGALIILALSILYAIAADLDWFAELFLGIKAAVLAIVVQALIRIGGRALNTRFKQYVAVAAFVSLFFFNLPFPLVVLGSGALGIFVASQRPEWLALKPNSGPPVTTARPWAASARTVIIWGLIWAAPLVLILVTVGRDHVLWDIGSFFSQLAIVTFGGAYAVLAYMAQEAVQGFGWLSAGEMADGLGLAETTPGPLIMVTQFVGYLAAFRAPEPFTPLVAGIIGAGLTTWVTFSPCFMWIFAFAPWLERMENASWLKGGLATLTAAVVGVIANLTVWFALHVFFSQIDEQQLGALRLYWLNPSTFSLEAALLAIFAAFLIFRLRWNVIVVLVAAGLGGIGVGFIT